MTWSPPRLIDGIYELDSLEPPRYGGMSLVQAYVNRQTHKRIAIKFLLDSFEPEIAAESFKRDFKSLDRLRHENIARLLGHGEVDKHPYLVLEWYDNSLADFIAEKTREKSYWSLELFECILEPVAKALQYAHTRYPYPVEHRDLKLENVMLKQLPTQETFTSVLVDFGIAKLHRSIAETQVRTVAAFHTPLYLPPWQVQNEFERDVYAFGVLFLKCIYGDRIKDWNSLQTYKDSFSNMGEACRNFVERCLDPLQANRYQSAVELVPALQDLLKHTLAEHNAKTRELRLQFTKTAWDQYSGAPDKQWVESTDDLLQAFHDECVGHIFFDYLRNGKEVDTETVRLATAARVLNCKFAESQDKLIVTSVQDRSFRDLERMRANAVDLSGLPIVAYAPSIPGVRARTPAPSELNLSAITYLKRALTLHIGSREHSQRNEGSPLPHGYLAGLTRALEYRESLLNFETPGYSVLHFGKSASGDRFELELAPHEADSAVDLEDDDAVELLDVAGRKVLGKGVVMSRRGLDVLLSVSRLVGAEGEVGLVRKSQDASRKSLKRQREALDAILDYSGANPSMADWLEDPSSAAVASRFEINDDDWLNSRLDTDKRAAVSMVLSGPDISLIQGPPGTGKTEFITEVVRQTLLRDPSQRILIVSQTHVAVDNAIQRLRERGVSGIVRLASTTTAVDPEVQDLLLTAQAGEWREKIRADSQVYIDAELAAMGVNRSEVRAYELIGQMRVLNDSSDRLGDQVTTSGKFALDSTSLTRSSEIVDPEEIHQQKQILADRRKKLLEDFAALFAVTDTPKWAKMILRSKGALPDGSLAEIQQDIATRLDNSGGVEKSLLLLNLHSEWVERVPTDSDLLRHFLSMRQVIAGTAVGFRGERLAAELEFDLCIIDEASKATGNELLVPLAASRRIVLVGDSKQLPPTNDLNREALDLQDFSLTEAQYSQTLFDYLANELPEENKITLREQHRMVPAISALISTCFYDGELRVGQPAPKAPPNFTTDHAVCWYACVSTEERTESKSRLNTREADIAISVLRRLNERWNRTNAPEPLDVLVVSPYSAQVTHLKRRIAGENLPNLRCDCLSVDSVQGRQASVVVVSLVASNRRNDWGFLEDWRRLNVALSRGRYELHIIGNISQARNSRIRLREITDYIENSNDCKVVGDAHDF